MPNINLGYPVLSGGSGNPSPGTASNNGGGNGFVLNPNARSGQGPFGAVPGALGLPNPAGDLGRQFPNLQRTNAALSNDIFAGLSGNLSPGTLKDLQDFSAAWGINSGMPGSGLQIHRTARDLGLTAEQLKDRAITQYNQTIPTISNTQTVNPALQNQIAEFNAINSAAPDPSAAGSHAEDLYNRYLQMMRAGAGGGGGINFGGGGGGGGGFYRGNVAPPAADSMGEVVANSLAGGGNTTAGGGNNFYGAGGSLDPFMDQWNADWDQSSPITSGSDYSMFGDYGNYSG